MATSIVDVYPLVCELRTRTQQEFNLELTEPQAAEIIGKIVQLALGTVDTRIYHVIARGILHTIPLNAALQLLTDLVGKLAHMVTEIARVDITLVTHEVEYHLNIHGTLSIFQRPKPLPDMSFEQERAVLLESMNNGDYIPEYQRRAYKL